MDPRILAARRAARDAADRERAACREVLAQLPAWLMAHPTVWAGWPTSRACDEAEQAARVARVRRAHWPVPAAMLDRRGRALTLSVIDEAVAALRVARREGYRRRVEEAAW